MDDSTGGIEGMVIDDQIAPIAGAQVGLTDVPGVETVTDEAGRFSLSKVPPGPHTLVAQKLGFDSKAMKVEVVASEVLTGVQITLAPIPIETPYPELLINRGIIKIGVGFVLSATCSNCGSAENKFSFPGGGLPGDMSAMMVESTWNTMDYLGIDIIDRTPSTGGIYWRVRAASPMHFLVESCVDYKGAPYYGHKPMPCDKDEYKGNKITAETWYIGGFQQETHNADPVCKNLYPAGCYGLGVAPEIVYTNYFTIFHGPAPDDVKTYSALPDA